jgi:hypothetical protein
VPEYVIEFSESAPMAFDAAAMTGPALCADATAGRKARSAASVSLLSVISCLRFRWSAVGGRAHIYTR